LLGFGLLCFVIGSLAGVVEKNTMNGVACYLIFSGGAIAMARTKRPALVAAFIFGLVTILAAIAGHRTIEGMGILGFVIFLTLRRAPFRATRLAILFATAAGSFLLIAYFAGLFGRRLQFVDEFLLQYTGRNAESGRQIIWPIIIHAVNSSPIRYWFGLGSGATFSSIYASQLSAHNYFLQTYMQTGTIGLALLIALFIAIWRSVYFRPLRDPLGCYMTTLVIVVLIHSSLEVFLMQVNLDIGVNAWMALGLGAGMLERKRIIRALRPPPPGRVTQAVGRSRNWSTNAAGSAFQGRDGCP